MDASAERRGKAEQDGLDGGNAVMEAALRLYFANCSTAVWEKQLSGGWIKKLIVRPGRVVVESIRIRTVRRGASHPLTDDALRAKEWTKVGQMKQG